MASRTFISRATPGRRRRRTAAAGCTPRRCRYAMSATISESRRRRRRPSPAQVLGDLARPGPASSVARRSISAASYGTPIERIASHLVGGRVEVDRRRSRATAYGGMFEPGETVARVDQVPVVPEVRVLAALAREVGPGALGAPLERVVVHATRPASTARRSASSRTRTGGSSASGSCSNPRARRCRAPRARARGTASPRR